MLRDLCRGLDWIPDQSSVVPRPDILRRGKLYRARSRLYRNEILQVNMLLKALVEIYTMHSFAQLCNLKILSKNCQNFAKILQKFNPANLAKLTFCKFLQNFGNMAEHASKFLEKCYFRAVQRSASCRSRRELSNAYLLVKFGFDTAENEPCKACPIPRFHAAASVSPHRASR